jgi:NAD-dependent deacetylase
MLKIVVLTGSGISKESGLSTFRDHDGLWEGHNVHEVASIDAWYKNPEKVLDFYNQRRIQAYNAQPNLAHLALKELELFSEVTIITQNVDDLHEKAGSEYIIHLHGSLFEAYPDNHPQNVVYIGNKSIYLGDTCDKGFQLRPNIVWFGEMVPKMEEAMFETLSADIFIVIGTSLLVYPAASLLHYVQPNVPIYIVDPILPPISERKNAHIFIQANATEGVVELVEQLKKSIHERNRNY